MAEQLELFPDLEPTQKGSIQMEESNIIEDAEWCFQFFNNEPVVFGYQNKDSEPSPLMLQIQPTENDNLTFSQNGMQFKIFARTISEETKLERENASKNKETQS